MADPVSLGVSAAVSIGGSLIGGLFKAQGDQTQAQGQALQEQAQSQMYQYKAGVALFNKAIADQNASYSVATGDIDAEDAGLKSRQEIASTKASQAGSGVDINSGSAADLRDTQSDVAENDQNTIRMNSARKAYGFQIESAKDTAEAGADVAASQDASGAAALALQGGNIAATGSLVGTATSVAAKWMQASSSGIFSSKPGPIGTFDPNNFGAAPTWSTG